MQPFNIGLTAIIVSFLLINTACSKKTTQNYATDSDVEFRTGVYPYLNKLEEAPCKTFNSYQTSAENATHFPVKWIKLNFHFMDAESGTYNFTEADGIRYANALVQEANKDLRENQPMHLPIGNTTPNLPIRIQFEITKDPTRLNDTGIYFHKDEELWYLNTKDKNGKNGLYSNHVYDKYGIRKKEVLNVFMMEHHPDSIESPTYKAASNGIGKPYFVKMSNCYLNQKRTKENPKISKGTWFMAKLLNHEVGHSLGLYHSWTNSDGCDDTPPHDNCWNKTKDGPCNGTISNNIMDYNAYGNSLTPCQIAKMHFNIQKVESSQRKITKKTWCTKNTAKTITIKDNSKITEWFSSRDIESDVIIEPGAKLALHCDFSFPKDASIIVKPGAELILNGARLYNDCGEKWKGIMIEKAKNLKGKVIVYDRPTIVNAENAVLSPKN